MMKPLRRFFGFAMYLFISLPLLLGSMTMLSVRPWLTDPAAYKLWWRTSALLMSWKRLNCRSTCRPHWILAATATMVLQPLQPSRQPYLLCPGPDGHRVH
jgi:hypothetical protein